MIKVKIKLTVKPNSSKNEVIKIKENEYKVNIKAPPQEGKANIELVRLLKKYFKKQVRIISGLKSKEKVIEV